MRSNARKLRLALGLTFCSLLLAASGIDGSSTAAAFGFGAGFGGGFGRMGGFGGPGRGFGGGPRAMAPGRGGAELLTVRPADIAAARASWVPVASELSAAAAIPSPMHHSSRRVAVASE